MSRFKFTRFVQAEEGSVDVDGFKALPEEVEKCCAEILRQRRVFLHSRFRVSRHLNGERLTSMHEVNVQAGSDKKCCVYFCFQLIECLTELDENFYVYRH